MLFTTGKWQWRQLFIGAFENSKISRGSYLYLELLVFVHKFELYLFLYFKTYLYYGIIIRIVGIETMYIVWHEFIALPP
jgi:hypothetical protein